MHMHLNPLTGDVSRARARTGVAAFVREQQWGKHLAGERSLLLSARSEADADVDLVARAKREVGPGGCRRPRPLGGWISF